MPTYVFTNVETGETWEEFCSFSRREEILQNPNIQQLVTAPALISGVGGLTHKTDSGFNDMLNRIAVANPNSALAQTHGDKGIKASKIRQAVNKVKAKNGGSLL